MQTTKRQHPAALPHGELKEVFPDIYFVTGTVRMPGPLPIAFSRNMTVVRQDGELTLVNAVRLDEGGLAALGALGKVAHVVRLAGYHGMDDAFYQERYGARVWAVRGQVYAPGFDPKKWAATAYFQPDVEMDADTALPLRGARLHVFHTTPSEGLLLLDREGGILVAGDALQNWQQADPYFSLLGKLMMKGMGFIKPHNLGPGWLRAAKPAAAEVRGILDLPFAHVLPSHGTPVIGDAREKFRPVIERYR